jgi:hypothetical protein
LWHWKQVSSSVLVFSANLRETGTITVWHSVHATALLSWMLPFQ